MKHRATLHAVAVISLWMMASAGSGCSSGVSSSPAPITSAQAHQLVETGALLVDVRTEREWTAGHLEGAVHIPVDELGERMSELPSDRALIVYCASGARSARAAGALRAANYDVHDLGGMSRWAE